MKSQTVTLMNLYADYVTPWQGTMYPARGLVKVYDCHNCAVSFSNFLFKGLWCLENFRILFTIFTQLTLFCGVALFK